MKGKREEKNKRQRNNQISKSIRYSYDGVQSIYFLFGCVSISSFGKTDCQSPKIIEIQGIPSTLKTVSIETTSRRFKHQVTKRKPKYVHFKRARTLNAVARDCLLKSNRKSSIANTHAKHAHLWSESQPSTNSHLKFSRFSLMASRC